MKTSIDNEMRFASWVANSSQEVTPADVQKGIKARQEANRVEQKEAEQKQNLQDGHKTLLRGAVMATDKYRAMRLEDERMQRQDTHQRIDANRAAIQQILDDYHAGTLQKNPRSLGQTFKNTARLRTAGEAINTVANVPGKMLGMGAEATLKLGKNLVDLYQQHVEKNTTDQNLTISIRTAINDTMTQLEAADKREGRYSANKDLREAIDSLLERYETLTTAGRYVKKALDSAHMDGLPWEMTTALNSTPELIAALNEHVIAKFAPEVAENMGNVLTESSVEIATAVLKHASGILHVGADLKLSEKLYTLQTHAGFSERTLNHLQQLINRIQEHSFKTAANLNLGYALYDNVFKPAINFATNQGKEPEQEKRELAESLLASLTKPREAVAKDNNGLIHTDNSHANSGLVLSALFGDGRIGHGLATLKTCLLETDHEKQLKMIMEAIP